MNQHTEEPSEPKAYMLQTDRQLVPPHLRIVLTEVDLLKPLPDHRSKSRKSRWKQWWTEERLALLAIVLGNLSFLVLAVWWFM